MSVHNLLQLAGPLQDSLDIPYHDLGPRDKTPQLALVAGLHGNELNGVFVLSRLAAFLGDLERGVRPGQSLCHRVLIIPTVNVLSLNRRIQFRHRSYAEGSLGRTTHQVAEAVLEITRQAYYRVDIHNANLDMEEMPQVRLYAPNDDERATACLFGLSAVVERPMDDAFATTLVQAWRGYGGENMVIQAGQAGNLQPQHCETLFQALVAFLDRTGIIRGVRLAEQEDNLHYFGSDENFALVSDQSGLFVSRLEVGRWLQAGDVVGEIYDGFTGVLKGQVICPVSGLLSGLRRQPLLFEGDLIARIQMRGASGTA